MQVREEELKKRFKKVKQIKPTSPIRWDVEARAT